ncbi:MAG: peptidoglycan-binding protein [Clostridia bacterium]|nr:peptidoglycan-binding protein [Clostridia bacterium]
MNFWENDITIDRRPYVMELQRYLRALERERVGTTTIPQDGFFGADTTAGVRRFQQLMDLETTGVVDRQTWEALVSAYLEQEQNNAPPLTIRGLRQPLLQPGDDGNAVVFLNVMLGLTDTVYTTATEEAVRQIQSAALLPVTGNTDTTTWNAVVRLYNQGGAM